MAVAASATYFSWINVNPENAFLKRCSFSHDMHADTCFAMNALMILRLRWKVISMIIHAMYRSCVNRWNGHEIMDRRRRDFERAGVADKFQEHPSKALQEAGFNKPDAAYWMYQDTRLNISSLAPVLDAAFISAGVTKMT